MAYYVRVPRGALGNGSWIDGEFHFIASTPLVMHDAPARTFPR
jgi:hypothetical protein